MKIVNHTLIKSKTCYSFKELSEVLMVCQQTIWNWHSKGMKVLDENSRPYLVMGEEVRKFITEQKKKRKIPIKEGEFFCPRCKNSRASKPVKIKVIHTDRFLSPANKQIIVKGECILGGSWKLKMKNTDLSQ